MGKFIFNPTEIKDVFIVDTKTFTDDRGYFMETYSANDFKIAGLNYTFVQDNQSSSQKGVVRGLHFQKHYSQAKLVRVLFGKVFDVAVDLRKGSNTYGKWVGVFLSSDNKQQLLIPRGFAHGFMVVSDHAELAYKCDELYHPEDEGGIIWNDTTIGIEWPNVGNILLSAKDKNHPTLVEAKIEL